jgi:hypothetical protein
MTLSPELLAMIEDVPPATDEEIETLLDWFRQYTCGGTYETSVDEILSLISRIVAERKAVKPEREQLTKACQEALETVDMFEIANEDVFGIDTLVDYVAAALSALEERGS